MAEPTILLTGGSGLLALNWYAATRNDFLVVLGVHKRKPQVFGAVIREAGIECVDGILSLIDDHQPTYVVHTAGCTSVEVCEQNPDLARHVNIDLAENVAKACAARKVPLVHISTDHLFQGGEAMASEEQKVSPLNVYGKTKAEAEVRVMAACPESLVIRTNFYGWGTTYRKSFSDVIIDALRKKRPITLFDDVSYTPIVVPVLVDAVQGLLTAKATGVFNVSSSERLTKYQFGLRLAQIFGHDPSPIRRGKLIDLPELVGRPRDMSLSNSKVCKLLGKDLGSVSEHLEILKQQEQQGLSLELGNL